MPKKKTIVQQHKANFETLRTAFLAGQVCLMDCIEKATGEHVAVICAVQKETGPDVIGEQFSMVPFAKFFNGNPYEMLESPMEYDKEAA